MIDLPKLRSTEFARALSGQLHLNHAGISPLPSRTTQAIGDALHGLATDPQPCFMNSIMPAISRCHDNLGELMGVTSDNIALVKNTGHGLSIIADGLVLSPGDNVITVAKDYPAVVYPWLAQASRGVETRIVDLRPDGSFRTEDIEAKIDHNTRVIALSWVQFATGYRINPREFADMAHRHGALLVLDVIQGLGVHPLRAEADGIDAVVTGSHKWLMSPSGTGGLYVSPKMLDRMRLVNMGAGSVKNVFAFDSAVFEVKETAQRFEEGSPNGIGVIGLSASTGLILETRILEIQKQVQTLTENLTDGLSALGYTCSSIRDADHWSGIVIFTHNTKSNDQIVSILDNAKIRSAIRGGSVRLSPHFYNDESDIANVLEVLS